MLIIQLLKTHQILKSQSKIKNTRTHFLISANFNSNIAGTFYFDLIKLKPRYCFSNMEVKSFHH